MEVQRSRSTKHPGTHTALARTIRTDRDYREGKTLLGRTMRGPRSFQAALRAEALLKEIVDYEIRLDAEVGERVEALEPGSGGFRGLHRRWTDLTG